MGDLRALVASVPPSVASVTRPISLACYFFSAHLDCEGWPLSGVATC